MRILVVEDNKAVKRTVQTGYGESGMVEIVDGLSETDNVIVVGQLGLKADAEVKVINAPPPEEPEEAAEPEEAVAQGDN